MIGCSTGASEKYRTPINHFLNESRKEKKPYFVICFFKQPAPVLAERKAKMSELIKRDAVLELLKYWKHLEAYDKIAEMEAVKTKQIKYYDEDKQVWKIGRVIVDEID